MDPIAHIRFADGPMRPVFEDDGRQFVIDDDGDRVYGIWYIPRDECATPIIVEVGGNRPKAVF